MLQPNETPVGEWGRRYFRMHPQVHTALKVASAVQGETMEKLVHKILCGALSANGDVEINPTSK